MSLNFMVAVTLCSDFGPKKIKSATVSTFSPSIWHVMELDVMILFFECWDVRLDRWIKQMILIYIDKKQLEIWTRCIGKTTNDDSWDATPSVSQSCLPLCNPMDCSPPGSSVQGILQARILEWVADLLQGIFLTRGLNPRLLSLLAGRSITSSTTWEAQEVMKLSSLLLSILHGLLCAFWYLVFPFASPARWRSCQCSALGTPWLPV